VIQKLLNSEADIAVVIDHAVADEIAAGQTPPTKRDYVVLANQPEPLGERFMTLATDNTVREIGPQIDPAKAHGEWIGLAKFSAAGAAALTEHYHRVSTEYADKPFHNAPTARKAGLTDLLSELLARGLTIATVDIYKGWIEVDTFEDYLRAWRATAR